MNAVFIQIEPDHAARIERNPELAEALFEDPHEATKNLAAMGRMSSAMQERVKAAGPQMLAQAMSQFNPETRKALEERLGRSLSSFASGQGGEDLLKMMQQRQARAAEMMETSKTPKGSRLSLDKEWHGIHYLVTGKTEPDGSALGTAVLGGKDLGDDEEGFSGYGPARLLSPDQVKRISDALGAPQLETEASSRFDAAAMNKLGLYPGFRSSDLDGLLDGLRRLRAFYAEAAAKGRAIVTCLV